MGVDDAFKSKLELVPKTLAWNSTPPVVPKADGSYPVALPGTTVAL